MKLRLITLLILLLWSQGIIFPEWSFERAKSAAGYLEGSNGIPGLILKSSPL